MWGRRECGCSALNARFRSAHARVVAVVRSRDDDATGVVLKYCVVGLGPRNEGSVVSGQDHVDSLIIGVAVMVSMNEHR